MSDWIVYFFLVETKWFFHHFIHRYHFQKRRFFLKYTITSFCLKRPSHVNVINKPKLRHLVTFIQLQNDRSQSTQYLHFILADILILCAFDENNGVFVLSNCYVTTHIMHLYITYTSYNNLSLAKNNQQTKNEWFWLLNRFSVSLSVVFLSLMSQTQRSKAQIWQIWNHEAAQKRDTNRFERNRF